MEEKAFFTAKEREQLFALYKRLPKNTKNSTETNNALKNALRT